MQIIRRLMCGFGESPPFLRLHDTPGHCGPLQLLAWFVGAVAREVDTYDCADVPMYVWPALGTGWPAITRLPSGSAYRGPCIFSAIMPQTLMAAGCSRFRSSRRVTALDSNP